MTLDYVIVRFCCILTFLLENGLCPMNFKIFFPFYIFIHVQTPVSPKFNLLESQLVSFCLRIWTVVSNKLGKISLATPTIDILLRYTWSIHPGLPSQTAQDLLSFHYTPTWPTKGKVPTNYNYHYKMLFKGTEIKNKNI